MHHDISVPVGSHLFNLRAAAVVRRGDHVLACRFEGEAWSFLPGGRVAAGEPTEHALRRELREELDADVDVVRPLFLVENFFELGGRAFHELGVYHLVTLPEGALGEARVISEANRTLLFEWLPLEGIEASDLQPRELRAHLRHLPASFEHLVFKDD